MTHESNQHDSDFNPKVCSQIHKRVEDKIENVIDRMTDCEAHMIERMGNGYELIKQEVRLTMDSIKEGVNKLTESINAHSTRIDDVKDSVPDNLKKDIAEFKGWKNKLSGLSALIIIINGLLWLYVNHILEEAEIRMEEAEKLINHAHSIIGG